MAVNFNAHRLSPTLFQLAFCSLTCPVHSFNYSLASPFHCLVLLHRFNSRITFCAHLASTFWIPLSIRTKFGHSESCGVFLTSSRTSCPKENSALNHFSETKVRSKERCFDWSVKEMLLIISWTGFKCLQGFSKDIRMQKSSYIGYIKDYEGATLMHVSISDGIIWYKCIFGGFVCYLPPFHVSSM